ncbi:IS21 family transposase [Pengzhenrongella sicca]|uniref:IS21 family transposase n=1 Tax=Pengzhenrongella sicca TaxID=2819238 RepID=A0A8A4Z874_9MICO|nr:IS21 family transposase [Pengzhenrongella sicca]QTE28062.1 IS21 family transposase [Pengzhenrongella sicca]QTE30868.1 IS21 family transposase [Pengzhenrongella sicca]
MIGMEDWAEARRLRRVEGMAISAIARRLGIARNTVKKALACDRPPKYERPARGSVVDAVEAQVRELLVSCPTMPATVIAERIGWEHSLTVLKDRVRVLRPYYLPPDPATRTQYDPGARVQCDLWFPPVEVPLGAGQVGSPPVLVMVSGYSRMIFAIMLPSRQGPDLIAGHWALLTSMGAVSRELVWDNEGAVGSWRAGKPKLTDDFEAFRGILGIGIHQCRPRDPESKGLVERANGYLETSFLPGRTFTGPGDFNTQLVDWLKLANARQHRALGCRPNQRWEADRAAMLTLPPVAPQLGWRTRVRLPRDHYVRLGSNDYSVDPSAVGRFVEVIADLEQVTVHLGAKVVATHPRCWARWQTITDPAHRAAALAMSTTAADRPAPSQPADDVEQRDLGTYDAAFGLTDVA